MASFESGDVQSATKDVDGERTHLEGLLKDRINFYLVFASVFMLGLSRIDDIRIKAWALLTISAVSILIALAVLRTHCLVQSALADIRNDPNHPYTQYWQGLRTRHHAWYDPRRRNANYVLIVVPFMLTLFFMCATVFYFRMMYFLSAYSDTAI